MTKIEELEAVLKQKNIIIQQLKDLVKDLEKKLATGSVRRI